MTFVPFETKAVHFLFFRAHSYARCACTAAACWGVRWKYTSSRPSVPWYEHCSSGTTTVLVSGNLPVLTCAGELTWLAFAPWASSCFCVGHGWNTARATGVRAASAATDVAASAARKTRTVLMGGSSWRRACPRRIYSFEPGQERQIRGPPPAGCTSDAGARASGSSGSDIRAECE